MVYIYISLSKIQKGHLRGPELSDFALSENIKDRVEQPSALVYVPCLYKSH